MRRSLHACRGESRGLSGNVTLVRAIRFDHADRSFPASFVELAEPELPGSAWARVGVTVGGICGSDLHLFHPTTGRAPAIVPWASGAFPFVLGHEIAGRVLEAGPECGVAVGTRVAVDPAIPCVARGIEPLCANCARGHASCCLNLDSRVVTPGMSLGYTQGLGGGWAEQVLAHASMLHPLPDAVPDRAASLHEPVSIAAHGLMRRPPRADDRVAIVGAGIIGLAAVAAVRGLFPGCETTVIARHEHQAAAARSCGAHHAVLSRPDHGHFDALASLLGTRITGRGESAMLAGGFGYVIDAVGVAESVTESLRIVDNWGAVLLLGAAGISEVDLSMVWWKEAELVGAWNHCVDAGPAGGVARHSIDRALDVLAAGLLPHEVVVTHEFALEDVREAVGAALDKHGSGAIKVVFRP